MTDPQATPQDATTPAEAPSATPDASPEEAATATTAPPRAASTSPALLIAVLALLASGAWPAWQMFSQTTAAPQATAPQAAAPLSADQNDRLTVLEKSLDRALQQIDTLQTSVNALPADPTAAVRAQVDTLDEKLAALVTQTDSLKADFAKAASADLASKSFLVATLQLVTAWQQGTPFAAAWAMVQQSGEQLGVPALTDLSDSAASLLPFQDSGIPQTEKLVRDFAPLAQDLIQTTLEPSAAENGAEATPAPSFWQESLRKITSLVVIRKKGEIVGAAPDSPEALVARAETQLKAGNLSAALEAIAPFEDQMTDAAHQWLLAARARVRADELALSLTQSAAQFLSMDNKP